MNRRIAATERWGVREILARADELADRAIALWPSPLRGVGRAERNRDWQLAHQVLAALPHGTWTSYGDLAAFLGSGAQAVGNHLANTPGVVNAYRVLTSEGKVSDGFRWATPQDAGSDDVRARLAADGVRFTITGAADPAQQLTAEDLAALLAGTHDDGRTARTPRSKEPRERQERRPAPNGSSAGSPPTTHPRRSKRSARSSPTGRRWAAGSATARDTSPRARTSCSARRAAPAAASGR
ncbi:MGMT family protein [Streptomyces sp. HMX87]|uniref:MGMT family protein n=1 Tax=Streptomyces sp. HMX87 TaxID=3390849 RepID=UPI003A8AC567